MHKTIPLLLGASLCAATLHASAAEAPVRELRVYNWADYMLPEVPTRIRRSGLR